MPGELQEGLSGMRNEASKAEPANRLRSMMTLSFAALSKIAAVARMCRAGTSFDVSGLPSRRAHRNFAESCFCAVTDYSCASPFFCSIYSFPSYTRPSRPSALSAVSFKANMLHLALRPCQLAFNYVVFAWVLRPAVKIEIGSHQRESRVKTPTSSPNAER